MPETIHLPFSFLVFLLLLSKRLRILDSELYVTGYGVGKIISGEAAKEKSEYMIFSPKKLD